MTFVNGAAPFASQCPYGSFSKPVAAKVNLWNCNLGIGRVDLVEALRPLVIQADCKKKLISVRSTDGKLDSLWEVMPDNTFNLTVDGGRAILKDDGSGNLNCATNLSAEMFGTLDCADRDRVTIKFETVWWLDRTPPPPAPVPSATPSATPTHPQPTPSTGPSPIATSQPVPAPQPAPPPGTASFFRTRPGAAVSPGPEHPSCKIPQGCYFYATATIKQCE